MAIQIKIDTRNGIKGMRKAVKAARESALHDVAIHWWRAILPDHFKAHNSVRYGMKKRTDAYLKRKRREGKPSDPNVYTGRLKDKMTSTRPEVTVNRQGVKAVFRGLPRHTFITSTMEHVKNDRVWENGGKKDKYLNDPAKHPKWKENIVKWRERNWRRGGEGGVVKVERPDKVAELTAVDGADAKKLAAKFQEYFRAALTRFGGK